MINQLIRTYNELMASLATLPDEIAAAQSDLTNVKLELGKVEQSIKEFSAHVALTIEGKNAEERAAKLTQALGTLPEYQTYAKGAEVMRTEAAKLTNDVDNLTRQFAAVGYQAKLHAGMMAYLAAAGAVAPVDVEFYSGGSGSKQHTTTTNGNGHVTADDAAAIGL